MLIRIAGALTGMLCAYACYWSLRWTIADCVEKDFSQSQIESALRIAPGNPEYYVRLAEAEPALAVSAMQRVVELNPLNSSGWIELARAAEAQHDFHGAEQSLIRAVAVDKTFAPRWLLAEYYSRRRDEARFWPAIRAALEASYDDVRPLFDLCWNFAPNPQVILDRAVPSRPDVLRQYLDFLVAKNRVDAADGVAARLMRRADPDMVPSLLGYCDRLLEKNDSPPAVEVWNALATRRLLPYAPLAVPQGRSLTNATFKQPFLARGFGWRMFPVEGVFTQSGDGTLGLRLDFSGNQPESCLLLSQFVPVEPSRPYQLMVRYTSTGLQHDTGLKWRVLEVATGTDLLPAGGWLTGDEGRERQDDYEFRTPEGTQLVKLVLAYQRLPGTVRIEGWLSLGEAALGFGS